jgi:hypothetical protein
MNKNISSIASAQGASRFHIHQLPAWELFMLAAHEFHFCFSILRSAKANKQRKMRAEELFSINFKAEKSSLKSSSRSLAPNYETFIMNCWCSTIKINLTAVRRVDCSRGIGNEDIKAAEWQRYRIFQSRWLSTRQNAAGFLPRLASFNQFSRESITRIIYHTHSRARYQIVNYSSSPAERRFLRFMILRFRHFRAFAVDLGREILSSVRGCFFACESG